MKRYSNQPTTCQIGPVRASYEHVWRPSVNDIKDGKPLEYSITMLIPKAPHRHLSDPDGEISAIKAIMELAAEEGFGPKWKNLKLNMNVVKDGDDANGRTDDKGDPAPPYPGYWYLKASTNAKWPDGEPKPLAIFDGTPKPIDKSSGFVSGDWCRVKCSFATFDKGVNKGVTCYLEGVQWLFKDEPFGGAGGTQASEFDAVEGADDPFADC